jgi:hypothetical protein
MKWFTVFFLTSVRPILPMYPINQYSNVGDKFAGERGKIRAETYSHDQMFYKTIQMKTSFVQHQHRDTF